jgi:hypothetical protein
MLPVILGVGALALLANLLFDDESSGKKQTNRKRNKLFISFAIEDAQYRNYLVDQSKLPHSPFKFVDMSVKKPWSPNEWKIRCRAKMKRCDGVLVLISNYTLKASGAKWEMQCAKEEGLPMFGMHINKRNKSAVPVELRGCKVIEWTWENLEKMLALR